MQTFDCFIYMHVAIALYMYIYRYICVPITYTCTHAWSTVYDLMTYSSLLKLLQTATLTQVSNSCYTFLLFACTVHYYVCGQRIE